MNRSFMQATPQPAPEAMPSRTELVLGSVVGFLVLVALCIFLPGIPA